MGLDAGSRPICASDPRVLSRVGAPYAPGFTSFCRLLISPRIRSLQPAHHALDRFKRSLAQQLIVKRAPAHADLAMDTPDRELGLLCIKRSLPGKNKQTKRTVRCAL